MLHSLPLHPVLAESFQDHSTSLENSRNSGRQLALSSPVSCTQRLNTTCRRLGLGPYRTWSYPLFAARVRKRMASPSRTPTPTFTHSSI